MVTGTAPPPTPLTGKTLITSVVAFKVPPRFYLSYQDRRREWGERKLV